MGTRQRKRLVVIVLWTSYWFLLAARFITLILYNIFIFWCLLNESATITNCQFHLFPEPLIIAAMTLAAATIINTVSIILTVRSEGFKGSRITWMTSTFWRVSFTLLLSVGYDINVAIAAKTPFLFVIYSLYISEKATTGILAFILNCTDTSRTNSISFHAETWSYKVTLIQTMLNNMLITVVGTLLSAFKLATIPSSKNKKALMVYSMFMLFNIAYRKFLWDFFWMKLWRSNENILSPDYKALPR